MEPISINGKKVPITAESGVDVSLISSFAPFKDWVNNLDKNLIVNSIHFQSLDKFGSSRVGFLKFKADIVRADTNTRVPGIVFMRGGAVAVLVVINCKGKKYSVVTKQSRVPIGAFEFTEIPAGMLDADNNFSGVAAKELAEETGIVIKEEDLINLTKLAYGDKYPGMYPTAGGSDEFISLFLYNAEMSEEELKKLENRLGGVDEHEVIHLAVYPLDELWKITSDGKTLAALLLYQKLKEEGKIPE